MIWIVDQSAFRRSREGARVHDGGVRVFRTPRMGLRYKTAQMDKLAPSGEKRHSVVPARSASLGGRMLRKEGERQPARSSLTGTEGEEKRQRDAFCLHG